jgi:hypothetical protein
MFMIFYSKAVPLHATKELGGERGYSSYSSPISALDGGEWSAVPIGQEAGWAAEPVWTQSIEEKSFTPILPEQTGSPIFYCTKLDLSRCNGL